MKNSRIEETTTRRNAKIITLKDYTNAFYPTIITVKKVELKAQNFKNKTIKQSYHIDFLPPLPYLYINKTNIYAEKLGVAKFENSDLYYTYNIKGDRREFYSKRLLKKELSNFNKSLFKLRKSDKPFDLLDELFENVYEKNLSACDVYSYYGVSGTLDLNSEDYGRSCTVFFHIYLQKWRKFILDTYKNKVINLNIETLKWYTPDGLAKLQALLDLGELGYEIFSEINPLENLFYYIKEEKDFKTPIALEEFRANSYYDFILYLKNLQAYIKKNSEKDFFREYIKKNEPNKFEGAHYSWQAEYDGFNYLNQIHFLDPCYKIFGLKLKNEYGLSHFGQKHLYLQNYIFTEGPCLTASLELQKIKNLNIAGVRIKKNSFLHKLSLEQISLINSTLYKWI